MMMERRRFIQKLLTLFKTLFLMSAMPLPSGSMTMGSETPDGLHYQPLNGRSLRELALKKMHHGDGLFINPVGIPRKGRFRQLMTWKLFSENRFKKDLKDQPINPVSVDWDTIRGYRGVSVTFLKHASLMIKDIDLAIINLGAYEPRWFMAQSHINPQETARAFSELGAKRLMIIHWGTFRLGDEPVHYPPMALRKELEKAGLVDRWIDMKHGETCFLT